MYMANYTPNYQLHQWEPQDPFLRTDFNQDLQKIDNAITALREDFEQQLEAIKVQNPFEILLEITTGSEKKQIDLDVSKIDFSLYHKVELLIDIPNIKAGYGVRVNNISESTYLRVSTTGWGSGGKDYTDRLAVVQGCNYGIILFYPPVSGGYVGCVNFTCNGNSWNCFQVSSTCTWNQLKTINLFDNTFPVGSRIKVLAIKK